MIPDSENQRIEFKETWKDEFLEWICGFANANGGAIYVGVDDKGRAVGLKNAKRLLEDIPNKIVATLGIVCDIQLQQESGADYLVIEVKPSQVPVSCRGVYHYRSGATCQRLTGTALLNFLEKKMKYSWDDVANENATLEDIDTLAVEYFLKKGIAAGRLPAESLSYDIQQTLTSLHLLTEEGKLKNATLLLFAKNPLKFFPAVVFRIGRFVSDDTDLVIQDSIEGNILQMTDKVVDILKAKYLVAPIHYEGLQRIEQLEIPEHVLRELIFNSIIHKEYRGVHIQLRVYNDKLVLWNPGALPEDLPPEKLLETHPSEPRNANIASVFYKAGFIESWGRGIQKIITGLAEAGLPVPFYEACQNGVRVTIARPQAVAKLFAKNGNGSYIGGEVTTQVTTQVKRLLSLQFGESSPGELMELLSIRQRKDFYKRYLRPALETGVIEPTQPDSPKSPTQKYRLTAKGREMQASLQASTTQNYH